MTAKGPHFIVLSAIDSKRRMSLLYTLGECNGKDRKKDVLSSNHTRLSRSNIVYSVSVH